MENRREEEDVKDEERSRKNKKLERLARSQSQSYAKPFATYGTVGTWLQ